jgi:hypothetical protein
MSEMNLTAGEVLDIARSPAPAHPADQFWKAGVWAWVGTVVGANTGTVFDLWTRFDRNEDHVVWFQPANTAQAKLQAVNDQLPSGDRGVGRTFIARSSDGADALAEVTQRGTTLRAILTPDVVEELCAVAKRYQTLAELGV